MTDEIKKMKCNRCKVLLPDYKFTKKKNDEYQKSCERCRGIQKEDREKNKCPHNKVKSNCNKCNPCPHDKVKYSCVECNPCPHQRIKSMCAKCNPCPHDKRKSDCAECNPCPHQKVKSNCSQCNPCPHNKVKSKCVKCNPCPHDKLKSRCKECNDAIKITIRNMINHSKTKDKKLNIYDADRFIDKCFIEGLVEDYPNCYYKDCNVELQYVDYKDSLATIERLNNSIGHIKSNCVLCCRTCNYMRKSNR